jgi:uncharacterized membrane protein YcaP (DUF421 family)
MTRHRTLAGLAWTAALWRLIGRGSLVKMHLVEVLGLLACGSAGKGAAS